MQNKVLIAYASKYGATKEIAERMGATFSAIGFIVNVLPIGTVNQLDQYDAIIIGSGVYIGQWRKEAAKFLKQNISFLKDKKVWLFSSGPTGEGDPVSLVNGWTFPEGLKTVSDEIVPRSTQVFHGAIDEKELSWLHKWMIGKVKAPIGDFRDWQVIEDWAKEIAKEIS